MRQMFSKKQVEKMIEENSSKLYKHTLTYCYELGINPAPEFEFEVIVINNDPTNYTYTFDEVDLQRMFVDEENIEIVSKEKTFFPISFNNKDIETITFNQIPGVSLYGYSSGSEQDPEDPLTFYVCLIDWDDTFEWTIIEVEQDERYLIGAKILDTVEKL